MEAKQTKQQSPAFRHILLPVDGSPASARALKQGVELAAGVGARITGLHVLPEFHVFAYQPDKLEDVRLSYERECEQRAQRFLAKVEQAAAAAGVPCDTVYLSGDQPWECILKQAAQRQCDLIAMASHGYRGVKALLLGSECSKVLAHSTIPVLILR